ncbi:MAG TPA: hypothetical protein VM925_26965 [Labilithrix sp.]|nr:hypothetical protein [Labilithrix sp.]
MKAATLFSLTVFALSGAGCDSCSRPTGAVADAGPTLIADASPINATPFPTASIAAAVNRDHLPAYAGPTGSVEGTITVTGDPAPETPGDFKRCPDAEKTYGHAFREGEPAAPGGSRWLADAVVAVTGYGNFFVPEKSEAKEITIQGCAFSTRTVTMTYGQRLEVKNLTKDFWTPKLDPVQTTVMMMATPGGDPVKLYPKVPGHYHLIDHDRKYVVDDLYAFLHPLHTASAVGGTYRIDGVPVGKVTVNALHPRIGKSEASKVVEIKPGVVTRVDLALEHKAPPPETLDAGPQPRLH